MSTYIFILGKDSELSLAELRACYPDSEVLAKADAFAVLRMKRDMDQKQFGQLGGQIKVGKLLRTSSRATLMGDLTDLLSDDYEGRKLNYAVSLYGWPERNLRPLLLDLKRAFRQLEISSRFANQDFKNLSVAQHKGLRGPEMIVAKEGERFFVAEGLAWQDIDAYSLRDYKKPFRDMKVGMLPPKLAQIMINLAGGVNTIWDPFCGGGVLLMEGLLMGRTMIGSDISAQTLEGARRNLDWLQKTFQMEGQVELFVHDATEPLKGRNAEAIVCEGYLGPPQEKVRKKSDLAPILKELDTLYQDFFRALKLARFKGPVILALPFFRTRDGEVDLGETLKKIETMGFARRFTYKYARPDQIVGRQLVSFLATG